MILSEAIRKQVDIIYTNDTEKADVLNILHLNGVELLEDLDPNGTIISINSAGSYQIINEMVHSSKYDLIPAYKFISANITDETTNTNEPTTHSSNVL